MQGQLELSRHAGVKLRGLMLLSDDGFVCHKPIREMDIMTFAPKSFDFRLQAQRALVIALDC